MQNILLIVHLILALSLIGVVLLQRSEGGGLGMGGGGSTMSGRGQITALGKLTWAFAIAFIATSIGLTILAAQNAGDSSVLDRLGTTAPAADDAAPADHGGQAPPAGEDLLPPSSEDAPALPPRAD